jgi:hypothetical protein
MKKNILIILLVLLIIVVSFVWIDTSTKKITDYQIKGEYNSDTLEKPVGLDLISGPKVLPTDPQGTQGFIGVLEGIDTGCFADAECFAVIEGKKLIVLVGGRGNQGQLVGNVQGVESFAELFNYIGAFVEVKAMKVSDTDYTLYGSTDYYIKPF